MFEGPCSVEEAGEEFGGVGNTDALREIEQGAGVSGGIAGAKDGVVADFFAGTAEIAVKQVDDRMEPEGCADEALEDADGVVVAGGVDAFVDQDVAELVRQDFL